MGNKGRGRRPKTRAQAGEVDASRESSPPATESARTVADLLLQNWGAAAVYVTPAILVGKLLVVSHGDLTVAVAIASSVNVLELVVPFLVASLPVVAIALAVAALLSLLEVTREGAPSGAALAMLAITGTLVVALAPAPWARALAVFAFAGLSVSLLVRLARFVLRHQGRGVPGWLRPLPPPTGFRIESVTVLVFGAVAFVAIDIPWLPAEELRWADGGKASRAVGYVLQESGDTLVVLMHEPRVIQRLSSGSVERRFCRLAGPASERSLVAAIVWPDEARTPTCDMP